MDVHPPKNGIFIGIDIPKSWFKVSTCATSKALSPKHQSQALKQPAISDNFRIVAKSSSLDPTFSQENPEIARDCMVFVDHWIMKIPKPTSIQYECYQGTSTMYIMQPLLSSGVWVIGTFRNVLIVIFRNLWYSTSSWVIKCPHWTSPNH